MIRFMYNPPPADKDLEQFLDPQDADFRMRVTAQHVDQFRNILSRALNCAPPHDPQYKDWFELADVLEGRTEKKVT